ncbi:MAG: hypothetical protein OHK0023_05810 [Anaerolineae bacterium]
MTDILVQYVVNERNAVPRGLRIDRDGTAYRPAPNNPPPERTARLDRARTDLQWQAVKRLEPATLDSVMAALRAADFFALPPQLLINYCKDDPPAGIWQVSLDGQSAQVVVFDPRPKRNAALDVLLATLEAVLA